MASQFPTPPVLTSDQIVAQLDALHPAAKAAALGASKIIGSQQPPAVGPPAPPNEPPATPGAAPPAETAPPPTDYRGAHPMSGDFRIEDIRKAARQGQPDTAMGFPAPTAPMRPIGGPKIPQGLGMPSPEAEEDLNEYHRLTAPLLSRNDPLYHSKANTGLPGAEQISNPFLRGLATVGDVASSFFPRAAAAIPGTTAHHNMLVNQQAKVVNEDTAQRNAQARQDLEEAQAEHARSAAQPERGKTVNTDQGVMQYHPETDSWTRMGGLPEKAGTEKLEQDDKGVWHVIEHGIATPVMVGGQPFTGKEKEPNVKMQQDEQGVWNIITDGKSTPVMTAGGQPFKGKAAAGTENEYKDFAAGYKQKHPNATGDDIAIAYSRQTQRPPQILMQPPNGGPLFTARPGVTPPPGSVTPQQAAAETEREIKEAATAKKARDDAQKEYQLVSNLAAKPSPTNDLAIVMRYIGATKPDSLGKLRLNQNEISLVLGTRSLFGDLEALAQKVKNGQMLIPQQRNDMLSTMKILAEGGETPATTGGGGPLEIRVQDIKSGKTGTIPENEYDEKLYKRL